MGWWAVAAAVMVLALPGIGLALTWWILIRMPGRSHRDTLPPLSSEEREAAQRMHADLEVLTVDIGPRHLRGRDAQLARTADWLGERLRDLGYEPTRERFDVEGQEICNIVAERRGQDSGGGIVIIGAHYDTVPGSPGANDNGSAVVVALELARSFARRESALGLRFVFFANEEAPWFGTPAQGSWVHAQGCSARGKRVTAMICLECLGFYVDSPNSQRYPPLLERLYPSTGDFVAFVGNLASRRLVHRVVRGFRAAATFPSQGLVGTETLLRDITRSDHLPFWRHGIPALMVTDTADFRYPYYHTALDLPEHVDCESLARIVSGLETVIAELVER